MRAQREKRSSKDHKKAEFKQAKILGGGGTTSLERDLEEQERLVIAARKNYDDAVASGADDSKSYATLDKAIKLKMSISREIEAIKVANGSKITAEEAGKAMRILVGEMIEILDSLPDRCGEACNPDNPDTAITALQAFVTDARAKLSHETK